MPLLPETKLLIAEYGNANFDIGEMSDDDPNHRVLGERLIRAKETLIEHLETHYTATPKA